MAKMKKLITLGLAAVMTLSLAACGGGNSGKSGEESKGKKEVYVLAAASMTDALTELEKSYEKEHSDIDLVFSFGSSGDLQTNIEEKAPADVFISAATKQMNALKDQDLMKEDSIIDLLENKVVLIKPADSKIDIKSFQDVATDKVKMVAIGGEGVPVGQYTQTIYENLKLWDKVKAKANFGKDVRQVLDWVSTKDVDCGIVYATDAAIEEKVKVVSEAPKGSCDPAIYPAGVVGYTENEKEAQDFVDFLKTDEAKKTFEKYKFTYIYKK